MHNLDPYVSTFLSQNLHREDYQIVPLAGDASNRRYFRIILDEKSWVLMKWDQFEPDTYPFLIVQQHLKKNSVRVPEFIHLDPEHGLILMEDLGDLTLERRFWESQNSEHWLPYYKMSLDELLKIHGQSTQDFDEKCTAFKVAFDTEKLLWELNYGRDNLIFGILGFKLSEKSQKEVDQCFFEISNKLSSEPRRIAHRDFHSRNLMIKLNAVRVIDFQDARMGPVQYDLVSLIKDSYVDISESDGQALLDYYIENAKDFLPRDFSRHYFDYVFEIQSIQRCFKACGSFASFFYQRQDRRYLKYLHGTLKRVIKSLSLFPEYSVLLNVLKDSGALDKNYESL